MLSINDFLFQLEDELKYLKPKDKDEVLKYYKERINNAIDYGDKEGKIIASLPKPSDIAKEIYQSKGINYLEKRKKAYKKNSIIKTIFSIIIVLILITSFFSITYILGGSVYNILRLFIKSFSMNNITDIITISILTICYILAIIIALIYIFDLLYILSGNFIIDILDNITPTTKQYKFLEFSASGYLEKVFNKKKILVYTLLISIFLFITSATISYISKGYIYRSLNNVSFINKEYVIKEDIDNITLNNSSVFVKVKKSEVSFITINYGAEFSSNIEKYITIVDKQLIINSITKEKFDAFNLLDEPLPILEILIPYSYELDNIELNVTKGSIDISNISKITKISLNAIDSAIALTSNNINELYITTYNTNIGQTKNIVESLTQDLTSSTITIKEDEIKELSHKSNVTKLHIDSSKINNATFNNSSNEVEILNTTFDTIIYNDSSTKSNIDNISSNNIIFKSKLNSSTTIENASTKDFDIDMNASILYLRSINCKKTFIKSISSSISVDKYNIDDKKENIENGSIISSMILDITLTTILFDEVKLSNLNLNIAKGKMNVTDAYICDTIIEMTSPTINILNLDGKTLKVNINDGHFNYNNDDITSNIEVTLEGKVGLASIGDGIKVNE